MQNAAQFAIQSKSSDALKGFVVMKVDEFRQSRTQRLNLSRTPSGMSQWCGIAVMAMLTQLIIALVHVGKPQSMIAATGIFTVAAVFALVYLGWIDGLIGASRIPSSLAPLQGLLRSIE